MNADDDLAPLIGARLHRVPDLSPGERERILARMRSDVHATRQSARVRGDAHGIATISATGAGRIAPALPRRSPSALLVAVAAAVVVLAAGAILLRPARPDPTLPGIAAIPSGDINAVPSAASVASPVAIPSPEPSPALVMRWTTARYPTAPGRQSVGTPWTDGAVMLLAVQPKLARQGIWVSLDAGSSWRVAERVDGQGRAIDDVTGGPFQFTKAGPTYYAVGSGQDLGHVNDRVLRSDDAVHWTLVTSHRTLPDRVEWAGLASRGLVAVGAVLTPDASGAEVRSVGGKRFRFRSEPVVLGSTDGVTWAVSAVLPADPGEQGCAYEPLTGPDGSMLVRGTLWQPPTAGQDGPTCDDLLVRYRFGAAWRSADGITFERVTSGPLAAGATGGKQAGTYDGGFFVQAYDPDTQRTTLWTSPDGDRWDAHPAPDGIGRQDLAVALQGGVFILSMTPAHGIAGYLLTPDGDWLEVVGDVPAVVAFPAAAAPDRLVLHRLGWIGRGRILIYVGVIGAP